MSIGNGRQHQRGEWFWYPIVRSQQVSGLSQKQFCEQKGVSYASFKNWSSRLRNDPTENTPEIGSFVPAVLTSENMLARDLPETIHEVESPVNKESWNFTTVKNDLKGEQTPAATESSPPLSKPAPPCLRDLGIRFDRGWGNGCTIVVPQDFDELTLHRLLKVVGG